MEEEIWKDINGYEGLYQVSNFGRVKSCERIDANNHPIHEKILKQSKCQGYLCVNLYKNGVRKMVKVHRLVALAFIPNPYHKPEVGHKDETRDNNRVDNLEWVTTKENNNTPLHKERVRQVGLSRAKELSVIMSERQKGAGNTAARPVICDDILFGCILDCANYYNIGHSRMKAWLTRQNKMPQEWVDRGLRYAE